MSVASSEQPASDSCLHDEMMSLQEAIRAGQADGEAGWRGLLERYPESFEVLGHLAWTAAKKGKHEEAIDLYRRLLEVEPSNVEARVRIGDRLLNLGRLEEAKAEYDAARERHPDCKDALIGSRYAAYLQKKQTQQRGGEREVYVPDVPEWTERQRANRELNQEEFERKRLRMKSLPSDMYLESTTKCNFYCKTCSKGYGSYYAEDLNGRILEAVQRDVMPANTRISITGFGEPTLAGNFDEILAMSLKNNSLVHFVTNASLLDFGRIEQLTRVRACITISFDGATKETFEGIRAGASFDRIMEKLVMIKRLRAIHLTSDSADWFFNFVALRKNIHELPDVVRIAAEHEIRLVGVADYAFNENEYDEESLRYDAARANKYLAEAKRVAEELGVALNTPPPYDEETKHAPPSARKPSIWNKIASAGRIFPERNRFPRRCSSPWSEPYIRTDGTVVPCCSSNQYLGDLRKDSFAGVWNGWRYRMLRWRIETTLPPLKCRRCFVSWGINGGNAGNVIAKEGLLVKAVYWFEGRLLRLWNRMSERLRKPEPTREPNYERGRPIRKDRGGKSVADAEVSGAR